MTTIFLRSISNEIFWIASNTWIVFAQLTKLLTSYNTYKTNLFFKVPNVLWTYIYELIFIKVDYAGSKGEEIIIKACEKKSYMMLKVRDLGFFVIFEWSLFLLLSQQLLFRVCTKSYLFCVSRPPTQFNEYISQTTQTNRYIHKNHTIKILLFTV